MSALPAPPPADARQDSHYRLAIARHGPDIARFALGYERDPARRQELLQEIHVALWQSFAGFREQCSLRTWAYRVAHNVGVTHIGRHARAPDRVSLDQDEAEAVADERADIAHTERRLDRDRLLALVHRLAPLDREVMLLYLEDLDAAAIGEVTGISARNVATKVHRIKALLATQLSPRSARP
jgi:RNA polymerase sigma-70 factor (ECF subfamily)